MTANAAQVALWNGSAGDFWAAYQDDIGRSLADPTTALLAYASPEAGENVLDVGCGAGQTSRILAKIVGSEGTVVGVDISAPMLMTARANPDSRNIKFIEADASSHSFAPAYDLVMSRFGVMFFDDPVNAFRNLLGAMNRKGRLAFICFRAVSENRFATVPFEALKGILPSKPSADPTAPGSFAFADPDRVTSILKDAGFKNVEIQPYDGLMRLGTLDKAAFLSTFVIGPAARGLEIADDGLRKTAYEAVKLALSPFETEEGVNMDIACWLVRAN